MQSGWLGLGFEWEGGKIVFGVGDSGLRLGLTTQ